MATISSRSCMKFLSFAGLPGLREILERASARILLENGFIVIVCDILFILSPILSIVIVLRDVVWFERRNA